MTRIRHVFRQDVPCLAYAALGDTAVRAIAIHHAATAFDLDVLVVPQPNPALVPLWSAVFGVTRVIENPELIPSSFRDARVSAPTRLDWEYGGVAWTVFEAALWENGFFRTRRLRITPPNVFPCDPHVRAVMVHPHEVTDGNRVYDADWWIGTCRLLRQRGYELNHLGNPEHQRLHRLYTEVTFDRLFPPTIEGIRACVGASSLSIGSSSGPTWACLLSDIRQIVLESRRSPHGYWNFDRCQTVLTKRLEIVQTLEAGISRVV